MQRYFRQRCPRDGIFNLINPMKNDQPFLDAIMAILFRSVVICLCLFAYLEFCRFTNPT
jgi:hypothetical protein